MESLFTIDALIALSTLTFLEIVLGIDNIIFISLVSGKLPAEQQGKAQKLGLFLALILRIILLMFISYLAHLTAPLFEIFSLPFTGRDLVLALGGLFLIAKSTSEIHHKMEGQLNGEDKPKKTASFTSVILQILVLDIVFSFDSILTAIGLTDNLTLMVTAIIIAMIVMMVFAGKVSAFINKYPTLQILALSFLILIGFTLILEVEAFHIEIPKGYIYFAVFFSLAVEALNILIYRKKKKA
jgi:predicted tellurium resistance membrane protein TerC